MKKYFNRSYMMAIGILAIIVSAVFVHFTAGTEARTFGYLGMSSSVFGLIIASQIPESSRGGPS
ncbi:MAG: hypothetical protein WCG02_01250 [Candidatus Taylorbacteria bacterium]